MGFEPTRVFTPCWFSRPVLSTSQTPLLDGGGGIRTRVLNTSLCSFIHKVSWFSAPTSKVNDCLLLEKESKQTFIFTTLDNRVVATPAMPQAAIAYSNWLSSIKMVELFKVCSNFLARTNSIPSRYQVTPKIAAVPWHPVLKNSSCAVSPAYLQLDELITPLLSIRCRQ